MMYHKNSIFYIILPFRWYIQPRPAAVSAGSPSRDHLISIQFTHGTHRPQWGFSPLAICFDIAPCSALFRRIWLSELDHSGLIRAALRKDHLLPCFGQREPQKRLDLPWKRDSKRICEEATVRNFRALAVRMVWQDARRNDPGSAYSWKMPLLRGWFNKNRKQKRICLFF